MLLQSGSNRPMVNVLSNPDPDPIPDPGPKPDPDPNQVEAAFASMLMYHSERKRAGEVCYPYPCANPNPDCGGGWLWTLHSHLSLVRQPGSWLGPCPSRTGCTPPCGRAGEGATRAGVHPLPLPLPAHPLTCPPLLPRCGRCW